MSERNVDGTPGVLIQSAGGGSYFIPHSDLSKYRLADEASAVVPDSLKGEAQQVSPNVTKLTAHEVPLLHHPENAAAGFPMPESDAAASFPMPESTASAAAFPMPEGGAAASFPMPESAASFPMPEQEGATFPAPEAHGAAFPMPEAD
jgi:hypothetical protein